MRASALCFLASLLVACGHTHVANDAPAPPADRTAAAEPAPEKAPETPRRSTSPTGTPLSTSPEGALADGAVSKLQARLVAAGHLASDDTSDHLDAPTRRALRAFQESHDLPATGVPDDATVRALGLDPAQVFRRANN